MEIVVLIILAFVFLPLIFGGIGYLYNKIISNFNKYLDTEPFWTFENISSFVTNLTVLTTSVTSAGVLFYISYRIRKKIL